MGLRHSSRIDPNAVATAEEAASRLDRSVATVWRRAARGELHPLRYFGRTVFLLEELEALAARLSTTQRTTTQKHERRPGQGTAFTGAGVVPADTKTTR